MPVDIGAHGQLVVDHYLDPIADIDPDLGAGDHPVVGPGVDHDSRLDLPRRHRRGQLESLGAVVEDLRLERLVAPAFGFGGEGHDRLRHRHVERRVVHLLPLGPGLVILVGGRVAAHHQLGLHPRLAVPGDRAEHRVGARRQVTQVQRRRFAGIQIGR